MADPVGDMTENLSDSALDIDRVRASGQALLRCVDTSVLRDNVGKEIRLESSEISIGRGDRNSVTINGIGVSRNHARIFYMDDAWHVQDLGSTNGTRVNNSNVTQTALTDGDTVAFGRVCYKFMKLDTGRSSRTLDLGSDQTLILAPGELAAEGEPLNDTTTVRSDTPRSSNPGSTTQRRAQVRAPVEQPNLLMWIAVVLAVLLMVVGALTYLS